MIRAYPFAFCQRQIPIKNTSGSGYPLYLFVIANDVEQFLELFDYRNDKKGCRYYPLRKSPPNRFVGRTFIILAYPDLADNKS